MRKNRIVPALLATAVALPCLSLGALGCYHERHDREVVVEPRHDHEEHHDRVVVKREVEVR